VCEFSFKKENKTMAIPSVTYWHNVASNKKVHDEQEKNIFLQTTITDLIKINYLMGDVLYKHTA